MFVVLCIGGVVCAYALYDIVVDDVVVMCCCCVSLIVGVVL